MKPTYYERNGITIYCGDCLDVIPELKPGFDAIIADLPYGTTACSWDSVIPLKSLWEQYKRLVKEKGAVVLFGIQPFTSRLVVANLNWFKYELVWKKDKSTGHLNVTIQPMLNYENILIFGKGKITYHPQITDKELRNIRPISRRAPSENYGIYGEYADRLIPKGKSFPNRIIDFPTTNHGERGFHPTQKPVKLLAYLIRTYTNPGELILDNTMGSGTTLVAAQNEGRRAVGIELSEEYCRIAVDRLRQPSFFSIRPANKRLYPTATQSPLFELGSAGETTE